MDILVVGAEFSLLDGLRNLGFRCHLAGTAHAARQFVGASPIDILLIAHNLPDESGLGLATSLDGFRGTIFVSLPTEDSCFWIPVLNRGRLSLGEPALRPPEFSRQIEELSRIDAAHPA